MRRIQLRAAVAIASLALLTSCVFARDDGGGSDGADDGEQTTVTMYAQAYTPDLHDAGTGYPVLHEFQKVAEEYEKEHPNIKIEFVKQYYQNNLEQVVRTKSSAGQLWDVFFEHSTNLNNTLPKGIATDLSPYFDQPNPYIPDNERWADAMNERVLEQTKTADGKQYVINGDYVTTTFYYNADLFDQAGIAGPPETWGDLLSACEKLKAIDVACASGLNFQSWWESLFLTNFYANDYETIASYDGQPGISTEDGAAAVHNGLLAPEDPRYTAWWDLLKEFTQYWDTQYLNQDPATIDQPARTEFVSEKVGMYYSGTWFGPQLERAGADFEWSTFSFPTLTENESEYATGKATGGVVGGYACAYQYAMASPEANDKMKDDAHADAVLDWMHYIGRPQVIERVVNELKSCVPTWPGTEPAPELESLVGQIDTDFKPIATPLLTPDLGQKMQTIFGSYMHGDIGLDQARSDLAKELTSALDTYAEENDVQFRAYKQ